METKDIKEDLKLNFKEFLINGNEQFEKGRFNTAVSSYFKAIAILCDLKIYEQRGLLPKNHTERFLFLQTHFKEAYNLVSSLFKKYTDSYNLRMNKKDALFLKENVEKIKKLLSFKEDNKTA